MTMTNRHMDKIFEDQQISLKNWLPLPNTQSTLFDVAQQQIYYLKDEEEDETFDQEWIDLRFIPWRFFYLDYHHLKQNIVESIGKGDDIEKSLESEWSKVYDFYCLKKSEIERKMISLYSLQQQQQANDKEEAELIQQLIMDIQQLYHFAKLNCCGFTRLFMQYNRRRLFGSSSVAAPPVNSDFLLPLRRLLVNKPFWDHSIELYDIATRLNYLFVKQHHFIQQEMPSFCVDLTIGITKLAINPLFCSTATKDSLSAVKNDNQNNISPTTTTFPLSPTTESTSSSSTTSNSNNTTTTTTTIQSYYQIPKNQSRSIKKYWVHPDNIVEVMLLLSSNKQLVLQNQDNNPTHTYAAINEVGHSQGNHQRHNIEKASIANEKSSMDNEIFGVASASTKVATIYIDSLDFEDYMARISGQPVKKPSNTSARCVNTRVRKYSLSASNNALNKKNATNNTTTEDTQQKSYHLVEQKVYCKVQGDNCDYHLYNKEGSKGAGKKPQQHYNNNISDNRQAANDSQSWIQQRVWLKSKHLTSWMDGKYSFTKLFSKPSCQYQREGLPTASAEEKKGIEEACLAIQDEVHNKLKVPVLKVMQNRVVYTSGNNNVAVSIDTDIAMMRCNVDRTTVDEGEEEEYPYYNMPLNDIVRFPYGVIHVSIQSESTASLNQDLTCLLNKLDSSPLLKPAHDFSSFLYGVGMLFANQVHVFPTWFTKLEEEDLRRTQHRGSLLFTTAAAVSKEEDEKVSDSSATILIGANNNSNSSSSSSVSGGLDTPYHNRTSSTIATIITCYDDEEDNTPLNHMVYSSSSSSSSSLLSPFSSNEHKKQRMRRSFDSYCSFDHPTSSSSDPTNCKSCMERYFNAAYDEDVGSKRRKSRDNGKEPVTFLSVMKEALSRFNRGITGSRFEKEPLLNDVKRRQYHSYDDDEELALLLLSPSNNNENNRFSRRVALLTMTCIFVSFTVSYLVYYLLFIVASKK